MQRILFPLALACAVLTWSTRPAAALEADQFTVPPQPLRDIGAEFDAMVAQKIQAVLDTANNSIRWELDRMKAATTDSRREMHQNRIAGLLSPDTIAQRVYEALGRGTPECQAELWIKRDEFRGKWVAWRPAFAESMFAEAAKLKPLLAIALTATVQMHGIYFGTDKIGHLFQQGYEYYAVYRKARRDGQSRDEAWREAVKLGISQEEGVYGHWWVGIYSNADMAGNALGLLFYLNLFEPIELAGVEHPPILVIVDRQWRFNPDAGDAWLHPFFTEHLNEARNPSRYLPPMREMIAEATRLRASAYLEFFQTDLPSETRLTRELSTLYGIDYGHSGFDEITTLADLFPEGLPDLVQDDRRSPQ